MKERVAVRGEEAGGGPLRVGRTPLRIEDVIAVAEGRLRVALDSDPGYRAGLAQGVAAVERALAEGRPIYGVSTGVGASVDNAIEASLRDQLPRNVVRFHGCGTGDILGEAQAAAVVIARLASLARGYSGVRPLLLERLCDFLNQRLLPRIPEEGSVGASGDLTPLSYLAAALLGEREVSLRGELLSAAEAHARAGLEPLELGARETLAIMNGTSVMTALGCLAFGRSLRLARWTSALTAVACDAMRGNPAHFDARIFALKPHPGTQRAGAWIRADLARPAGAAREPFRLQDRYSLRCAPHVIGVLLDALDFARSLLEIELNGVNDNPLVDPASGDILHGGNFYGGHLCFALDGLKTAVANLADLLDRQLCLLCDPATSGGLPANLVAAEAPASVAHHGFKAMQITASALTAEALKLTMPASAFSRSTESHNQDKVSMGTIAARESLRVLELTERVAAVHTLALCQAVDLREGEADALRSRALRDAVRKAVPINLADRRQDGDIAQVLALHAAGELATGDLDPR
jgi:histidine ammonia-lyase